MKLILKSVLIITLLILALNIIMLLIIFKSYNIIKDTRQDQIEKINVEKFKQLKNTTNANI